MRRSRGGNKNVDTIDLSPKLHTAHVYFHRRPVTHRQLLKDASTRQMAVSRLGGALRQAKHASDGIQHPAGSSTSSSLLLPPSSAFACRTAVAKAPPFGGMIKMFINTYPGQAMKRGARPLLGANAEEPGRGCR